MEKELLLLDPLTPTLSLRERVFKHRPDGRSIRRGRNRLFGISS